MSDSIKHVHALVQRAAEERNDGGKALNFAMAAERAASALRIVQGIEANTKHKASGDSKFVLSTEAGSKSSA